MSCADLLHTPAAHPLTTNSSEPPLPCPPSSPFALPASKLSHEGTATVPTLGSAIKGSFSGAPEEFQAQSRAGRFLGCCISSARAPCAAHGRVVSPARSFPCLSRGLTVAVCLCRAGGWTDTGMEGVQPILVPLAKLPQPWNLPADPEQRNGEKQGSSQTETSLWP